MRKKAFVFADIKGYLVKGKAFKRIIIALLVLVVLLQFIRPAQNNGMMDAPTDITHFVTVPDTVMRILKRSCYDCHSNYTNYPWYASVSPMSLLLANHIKNGKAELNFTEFSQYSVRRMRSKLSSTAEQVEEREMPLKSYLLIHRKARLSDPEIKLIKDWVDAAKDQLSQKNE